MDFSRKMLALANQNVPEMRTIFADMRELEQEPGQYDAVSAVYSLFHVPRQDHQALFNNVHSWLKDDGLFLFTYATEDYTGSPEFDGHIEFMRQDLFYSHDTQKVMEGKLAQAGFTLVSADNHEIGGETFLWVTAKK